MIKQVFLLATVGLTLPLPAQHISNTALYRDVSSLKYFRIHYENDYFSGTDIYYTQGINLEYVHPAVERLLSSKLLLRSSTKETKFGISLEHEGFTPTSLTHPEILYGDRPFAACLFLKTFSIVNDPERMERISSDFSAGVIGPAAGGEQIQEAIHRVVKATLPQGWQNQIQNDVILNYQADYERGLLHYDKYFLFSGVAGLRAGTFNTKATLGTSLMMGYFDNPFTNFSKQKSKTQVYLYGEPLLNLVGYDATLQGGLINKSSPYTISSPAISRYVFQGNSGLVIKLNGLQLEYFQTFLSKEFITGHYHIWGGVRVGWQIGK
jgi:lipid A 3-O-deacylase